MGTSENWRRGENRLRRQISGCKNPFVPFQHGANETTCFEPLQTLKDRDQRSVPSKPDSPSVESTDRSASDLHTIPEREKEATILNMEEVNDLLRGRDQEEIFQPMKLLSGEKRI